LKLKILKKLRTASFNSEFTGSYKKSLFKVDFDQFSCESTACDIKNESIRRKLVISEKLQSRVNFIAGFSLQ